MQVTNRRLRTAVAALQALSTRTLPTIKSDLKVVARLRELAGPFEDCEKLIRKIREEHRAPDGYEGTELPVAVTEARQRDFDTLMGELVDVADVPTEKLVSEADLPRALKSGAGEENRAQLADIVLHLDWLFATTDEE
jgi:hypothetical protein